MVSMNKSYYAIIPINVRYDTDLKGTIKRWLDLNITTLDELESYKLQNDIKNKFTKRIHNFNRSYNLWN